jgi:hypothetical protein
MALRPVVRDDHDLHAPGSIGEPQDSACIGSPYFEFEPFCVLFFAEDGDACG